MGCHNRRLIQEILIEDMKMPDKIESEHFKIELGPHTVKIILALAVLLAVAIGGEIPSQFF